MEPEEPKPKCKPGEKKAHWAKNAAQRAKQQEFRHGLWEAAGGKGQGPTPPLIARKAQRRAEQRAKQARSKRQIKSTHREEVK